MKIKVPKFMRRLACRLIEKAIEDETGIRTNIEIGVLTINNKGRDYTLCMAETISVNKNDLKRFIKESKKKGSI